jgi:hypothetical protein
MQTLCSSLKEMIGMEKNKLHRLAKLNNTINEIWTVMFYPNLLNIIKVQKSERNRYRLIIW